MHLKEFKSLKGLHVLVVDDDRLNLLFISHILAMWDVTVDVAGNGQMALEKISYFSYDLVLMDCIMPGLDGYEVTKVIRSLGGKFSSLPIFAFSTSPDPKKIEESRMDGMIEKPPADFNDFYQTISRFKK